MSTIISLTFDLLTFDLVSAKGKTNNGNEGECAIAAFSL